MIELSTKLDKERRRNAGNQPAFKSVAVVGAAGQTGELFVRTLAPVTCVEAVVKERRWRDEAAYPEVKLHTDIGRMLETGPEAVILATPNPINKVLEDLSRYTQKPLVLVLPQNGVDVVDAAEKILKDSGNLFTIVRASLFTNVSRSQKGEIIYNPKKNRIALASVGDDQVDGLPRVKGVFTQAGFDVRVVKDYISMEWSKLVANLLGSTSTVTGLSPREAFLDPEILALEHRALQDRIKILEAAGVKIDEDLWGIGKLRLLAKIPQPVALWFRGVLANMVAQERNNQLPAAARQINEGARRVESTDYYHKSLVWLGRKNGLESPVDEAIWDILTRHQHTNNDFSLASLEAAERRKLFLEIVGLETKQLFIGSSLPVKLIVDRLYEHHLDNLNVLGAENLTAVAETLNQGESVLVTPLHRSHADHPTVIKALREGLPEKVRQYPVYIVAGMKFDQEMISGTLNHSYPHIVVYTLSERDSEGVRWKAQIINRRAGKLLDKLLEKPCIFVLYPEGGRSKNIINGKVQLQEPAPGVSSWLLNPKFGLVVPTVITGTEKMLPPGHQRPRHAYLTINFCPPIKTSRLREQGAAVPRRDKDKYVSDIVMRAIAAKLPQDERGSYGY